MNDYLTEDDIRQVMEEREEMRKLGKEHDEWIDSMTPRERAEFLHDLRIEAIPF